MSAHPTLRYGGRVYVLYQGRILLDWRHEPAVFHPHGCTLCCTLRVTTRPGSPPRHPADCPNCGPRWRGTRPEVCHLCRRIAHFLDDAGRPVHKTCLEQAITAALLDQDEREAA